MDATALAGLSAADVAGRLKRFGYNELPNPEQRNFLRIAFEVFRQPMFVLLIGGGLLYLLLGEPIDAAVLLGFATLSVSISIVQETRSERVLEALRNLASPRALVIRDAARQRIPAREVVPDDLLVLSEGDRVPADGILLESDDLLADESLLTGESVPVRKNAGLFAAQSAPPGGDDLPFVYAGTLIARGSGVARTTKTGLHSEIGRIGQSLSTITLEQPRLQAQLNWLVRDLAVVALLIASVVVVLSGILRGSWLQAGLGGIAIGMSVMPEEIPLVLAVFMAMGAWRISQARVLTRRAAAIETLGSATVLCTDKTGTLTENRMRLETIVAGEVTWKFGSPEPMAPETRNVLHAALGASAPMPSDPMDRAVHATAEASEVGKPLGLLRTYGLRPDLFAIANLWSEKESTTISAFAKGAPETIADLCNLSDEMRETVLSQADRLAASGIRVLGVAAADLPASAPYPDSQRGIPFIYMGLIGFADPLRATVPDAVAQCRTAGIRVIVITGDYPTTARAIAGLAGIASEHVLSGKEIDTLSDAELAEKIKYTSVFARIRPQQKLRIVDALKRDGEIVAMTGDGVNDAPAMKAAHIGIAMGNRGTDVAREAASLVLLDDDFASIVTTIRLGRRIYDNLRKAIQYILSVHIPIAGLALAPFCFGLPLILMPIQIALLEMVIDPACSIVFESEREEQDVMRRPPRKPGTPVLPLSTAIWAALQGVAALTVVGLALVLGAHVGMSENDLRAFVFVTMVLMNIGLILVNRSFHSSLWQALVRPNPALWALVLCVILVLGVAIYWQPAQRLFHFGALHIDDLAICLAAGAGVVGLLEFSKRIFRAGTGSKPTTA